MSKPVRTAHRFATYPGDVAHMAKRHEVVGPNTLGEFMTAIAATYDPATDKTRVGFDFARKGDAS